MSQSLTILGIAGSLRRHSFNMGALRAAQELAPAGVKVEIFDLSNIPIFNQDQERTPPEIVTQFKAAIREADAILMATPEYNFSTSGILKNAIDWASRPYGDSAWDSKPVALMGAGGMSGTSRAQYHLRQVFVFLNMFPLNRPEVLIANARERFDEQGNLKDEPTRQVIGQMLVALAAWTQQLARGKAAPA